jgi:hypothetical protein
VTALAPDPLADREVLELLLDEPELLAIADAVAATHARPARRPRLARLLGLAAALVVALAVLHVAPRRPDDGGVVARALAAIGSAPVVHAVLEARHPYDSAVEIASGRRVPIAIRIEYWFDEERGELRTIVRRGGVVTDDRRGAAAELDPALAAFVTGYRRALAAGRARTVARDARVTWLELPTSAGFERVAVDRETFRPVAIRAVGPSGAPSAFVWRVATLEAIVRRPLDFRSAPRPPVAPFRGDVRASRALSAGRAARLARWRVLWLGAVFERLPLASLELQQLTRGYPPESGRAPDRGVGLRAVYGARGRYVELAQAPVPEPAYAFSGGRSTFDGNPIPEEGSMDLIETQGARRRTGCIGQLRVGGVYVTIWASRVELCLAAARALRPVAP